MLNSSDSPTPQQQQKKAPLATGPSVISTAERTEQASNEDNESEDKDKDQKKIEKAVKVPKIEVDEVGTPEVGGGKRIEDEDPVEEEEEEPENKDEEWRRGNFITGKEANSLEVERVMGPVLSMSSATNTPKITQSAENEASPKHDQVEAEQAPQETKEANLASWENRSYVQEGNK